MHFIQKHILKLLSISRSQRYSELKLPRVESNKFAYHLQKLITQGYVKKVPNGYGLTTKGVHYCSRVKFDDHTIRIQPKIVTLIVCKNKAGEFLVYERRKLPFIGMIGFPYGKVHLGESVDASAAREIKEKTAFSANLTQKGIVYLLITDKHDEVITHMLCHIYLGSDPKEVGRSDVTFDKIRWMKKEEILKTAHMPGVPEVLRIATSKKNGIQFEELSFIHE